MKNCIFCNISDGKIPAKFIYQDDEIIAFYDINPSSPVHFLVVPRKCIASLNDCDDSHVELLGKMLLLAAKLSKKLGIQLKTDNNKLSGGFKSLINTGPNGGQEIYHIHLHVMGGQRPW